MLSVSLIQKVSPFQNRSATLLDLDDFFGTLFAGLVEEDVIDNTYVFFSSDNGYHLGEHKFFYGKSEPYNTGIRLPMYVRGPGVVKGQKRPHPTTHIDITATIVSDTRRLELRSLPRNGVRQHVSMSVYVCSSAHALGMRAQLGGKHGGKVSLSSQWHAASVGAL